MEKPSSFTRSSRVEIGMLGMIIGGVVWLLTHILPVEAKVERHEVQLHTLEQKVDVIMNDTGYIRGKLDEMGDR